MRSRTSRGVSEWSGGKELYIESVVLAIGTSFRVIGIVPGLPEGPGGSTGWGHLPRGATWALGVRLGLHGPRGASPWRPMRLKVGNPKRGAPPCLGGKPYPRPPPPRRRHLLGPALPLGGYIKRGRGGGSA